MNLIMQMLMEQMGKNAITKIGKQLGLNSTTAMAAVSAAVPLLMSALARNSASKNGAASLHKALVKDHDGSILNNIAGFLTNAEQGNGAGILGHIFGTEREVVQNRAAQTAGVDGQTMGKVLEMVAPLVMGALGKTTQEQHLKPASLASLLTEQKQQAEAQQPDLFGSIGKLLDADGDGNPINDLGGLLGKFLR